MAIYRIERESRPERFDIGLSFRTKASARHYLKSVRKEHAKAWSRNRAGTGRPRWNDRNSITVYRDGDKFVYSIVKSLEGVK